MTADAIDTLDYTAVEVLHSSSTWQLLRARRGRDGATVLLRRPHVASPQFTIDLPLVLPRGP